MRPLVVPAGQRFGRLVVTGPAPRIDKNTRWECRCDCGNVIGCRPAHLKNGNIQSCGCLGRDRHREMLTTHGRSRSALYVRWNSMLARCTHPGTNGYRHYGGRGIKVCARWYDFSNFLADMGEPPGPGYSLDRIDNDGDYEPGNVRWATAQEQYANTPRAKLHRLKKDLNMVSNSDIRATLVKGIRHGNKPERLKYAAEVWIGAIDAKAPEETLAQARILFMRAAEGAPTYPEVMRSPAELAKLFGLGHHARHQ